MYYIKNILNKIIGYLLQKNMPMYISIDEERRVQHKKEQAVCEGRELIRMSQMGGII